jgi:hypothetical protein
MSPAIFSTTAARWTRATQQFAASPSCPTLRQLRQKLRRVRLNLKHLYRAVHEHARIYRSLAAREDEGSKRELIRLRMAEEADGRAERVEMSPRRFRVAHSLPAETWLGRVIRWFLVRWRINWTLALLDRMESRRSRAMLEALTQLSWLWRVIAAARMRPNQFFTRLSSRHPDDP